MTDAIYWLTLAGMVGMIGVILFAWCVAHQVRSVGDYVRTSKAIWRALGENDRKADDAAHEVCSVGVASVMSKAIWRALGEDYRKSQKS